MTAHQTKKLSEADLMKIRDRFYSAFDRRELRAYRFLAAGG